MRSEQGRVVVKARPTFVPAEQEALGDSISIPSTGKVALASGKDREAKEFTADGVYLPRDGDEAVYEQEVQPLVHSVHQGFNATILAYGASGSGKTYTMLGNRDSPGLANRIIDELFAFYDPRTCTLAVSIQELYNENFTDLVAALPGQAAVQPILATPRHSAKLTTKSSSSSSSNSSKGPARLLEGKEVRSSKELKQLVHAALRKRKTAATVLNETSSRSHAIITLTLQQRKRVSSDGVAVSDDDDSDSSPASSPGASRAASRRCSSSGSWALNAEGSSAALDSPRSEGDAAGDKAGVDLDGGVFTYLTGKLYLVDLAGSENIKRSGAEGKQQVEAGDINKSLCHLKTVIDQVFQGKKVPTYRNSKLTYKLRDALGGGNSKLLVIACISTARENLSLTKETLRFAEMARAIKNKPTVNRELKDEIITRLQQQIEELQDQLAKAAVLNKGVGSDKVLLQQLNAVEAAYAELQEETEAKVAMQEAKEARWAAEAEASQQHSSSLQQQLAAVSRELCATNAREATLQRQQAADQAELQQLQQALQQAQAGQADSVALLRTAEAGLQSVTGQFQQLQQQLTAQQAAARSASDMCTEQQQAAQSLQEQLKQQAAVAAALQQQLQREAAARIAAEQLAAQLGDNLKQEQAATEAAQHSSRQLGQQMQHAAADAAAAYKQLQQELAESQQQLQTQKQARLAAETLLTSVSASMQQVAADCSGLQQQVRRQQMQHARAGGSCSSCVTGAQDMQQLLNAECSTSQQLRQELHQQQLLLQSERELAAEQAAQLHAQLQQEREEWQRANDTAKATILQLQQQAADDKASHAAQLAEMQQRHAEQLEASLQSSVQKLYADKLRCREHISLKVHDLMAEAQSLSAALSSKVVDQLPETPTGTQTHVAAAGVADDPCCKQLPEQQQQQQQVRKQNSRYEQLPGQPEEEDEEDEAEQQQGQEAEAGNSEEGSETAAESDEGEEEELASESGYDVEPSLAGGSSLRGSNVSDRGSLSLAGDCIDSPVDGSSAHLASAHLAHSEEPVVQHSHGQRQQQQQPTVPRSSGGSVRVLLPRLSMAGLQEAAAAPAAAAAAAEGGQAAAGPGSSWPSVYRPEHELDVAAAQRAFAELEGEELKVEPLKAFLKGCRMGGVAHSMSLPCGKRKLKQHLIQDMLAYYQHAMLQRSHASSSGTSARHNSSFSASPDGACSVSCRRVSEASAASGASAATVGPLHAKPSSSSSSSGQLTVIDLCTPDTAKAAASNAIAGSAQAVQAGSETPRGSAQQTPRTPRSFGLGSSKAAAAASPASGSGIWGWLTPRSSSKKKQNAAAAAAPGSSSGRLAVQTDCISPRYDCDIAASPAAGADTLQRRAGPAAVAEGVVIGESAAAGGSSSPAGGGGRSAVELLMLQMQSDPTLGSPGPAVPLEALMAAGFGSSAGSSATGDVRVLQQGASLAHRSSWRHTQARAAAKAARR
uniref:Kinesin motor domain-containing protein n=1 Tax=Tetradesmus obliquus TaxID=3088 RepID=A0A383WJD2_TETOB|eukprot:jgi/Sobl393_1/17393/SZX76846.1